MAVVVVLKAAGVAEFGVLAVVVVLGHAGDVGTELAAVVRMKLAADG